MSTNIDHLRFQKRTMHLADVFGTDCELLLRFEAAKDLPSNDSIFKAEGRSMKLIYRSNLVYYFFAGSVG